MEQNILITAAGRRVELVKLFQKALTKFIPSGKVFASDANPLLSAACAIADGVLHSPLVSDPDYIDTILGFCLKSGIKIVVPTTDRDLLKLSVSREIFLEHGITIIISDPELVDICNDKRKTSEFCVKYNIKYPQILNSEKLTYPCFCKPFDGSGGKRAFPIFEANDLTKKIKSDPKMMFMEYIPPSYKEYTCDAYFSQSGHLKCLVPRERLEVRGGEVSKAITRRNYIYYGLVKKFNKISGFRGCLTIQCFGCEETGDIVLLEINPRFGGGFPLSAAAGANYCEWLIAEIVVGREVNYMEDWQDNLLMLRYDAHCLVG